MKITETSNLLIKLLLENKCTSNSGINTKTNKILKILYEEVKNSDIYIKQLKEDEGVNFYNLIIREIISKNEITKPKMFNSNSFPNGIINIIDNSINYELFYSFSLFDKIINIHLFIENDIRDINVYNSYIDNILVLLCILSKYSFKRCSNKLTYYIYLINLKKELPKTNLEILSDINVNTGFTYTCKPVNEIVIYRKEEWFKVLIHETIHNLGLDFSNMNILHFNNKIKTIFKVESEVNLYEAYTECWARIFNCIFCSYYSPFINGNSYKNFSHNFNFYINMERIFGFLQLVKILKFMGLKYEDLYLNNNELETKRKILYKEKTNVLSYYIITQVLLNNYQEFMLWCNSSNLSLINFNKTYKNVDEFYKFIEQNYKTNSMMNGIICSEDLLKKIKNKKSLRMSICELE